jgi:glutamyl-tRNA reductase
LPRFFSFFASGAAEHLFHVASGVDSLVVGDVQILTQVKDGYSLAHDGGTAGFFMNKLFQSAFHVGKRARSETQISEGAISVSYAAVELAERSFDNLHRKKALVIGAGDTAQLTAEHLLEKGLGTLFIANRTAERSEQLAKMVGGKTLPFESFRDRLGELDIIVSSVQTDRYVLTADDIAKINKGRHSGALFLIDIGMPRNIDPPAKDLENVFLYDIDSLTVMVTRRSRSVGPKFRESSRSSRKNRPSFTGGTHRAGEPDNCRPDGASRKHQKQRGDEAHQPF